MLGQFRNPTTLIISDIETYHLSQNRRARYKLIKIDIRRSQKKDFYVITFLRL